MHTVYSVCINVFDEKSGSMSRLEIDDAVARITAHELPDSFEMEAVKALAVAVRTTLVKRLRAYDGIGCERHRDADICTHMKGCGEILDMDSLKEYVGNKFDDIYNLSCMASRETSGLIITCRGRPIDASYHLVCGGGTENSEDVLGNQVMYFRKVLCGYCSDSPYWESMVDITAEELEDKLKVRISRGSSVSGSEIEGTIEEIERDETGRVRRIKIGGRYFSGLEVKNLLGLKSSRFGWDPMVIRFKVRGSGNGLGMCLYGANTMAREGRTCDDILKYYYTNISIGSMDAADEGTPLKGKIFVIDPGHGGEQGDDEKGTRGLLERDVNLDIALKLAGFLEGSGAEVVLTRYADEYLPLPRRVQVVNSLRPNFFISIHQNSFFAPGVSGTEVYYYRGDREGERLAGMILRNIVKAMGTTDRGCGNADFYLLRESKVSSIVVECMYITNPEEEEKLGDEKVRAGIARSIHRGVMEYYGL
jgi:SpoIID/LytB domain protein